MRRLRSPVGAVRASPLVLLTALAASCGGGEPLEGAARGRDVVVVMIDTLRPDRLSFYGHPEQTAPFLAGLAEGGVVFERAWSPSSWTAPSTASLFTSLYPNQHGVVTGLYWWKLNEERVGEVRLNAIPAELETLPELFSAQGYRTFGLADNLNIGEAMGFDRFDRFESHHNVGADVLLEKLAEWQDEISAADPSFVYLHFMDPHFPYERRDPWYTGNAVGNADDDELARYDSEIGYVDDAIRRAFELLGVDDQTVVVLVSDHGEAFGEHGFGQHPFFLYEELLRVALVVHAPAAGVEPGRVAAEASLLDVVPTLRQLLGTPASRRDEGRSLVGALAGREPSGAPRPLYAMRTQERHYAVPDGKPVFFAEEKRALLRWPHKYIWDAQSKRGELYDLDQDPAEARDLAASEPALARRMHDELLGFLESAPAYHEGPGDVRYLDAETLRQLEELGYVGEATTVGNDSRPTPDGD